MTLAINIIAKDGIVLASDSRATIGDPRGLTTANDTVEKLFKINDYAGMVMAGAGELGATLYDLFLQNIKPDDDIDAIVGKGFQIAYGQYCRWFPEFPPPNRPPLNMILTGYRKNEKGEYIEPVSYMLLSQINFAPSKNTMGFAAAGVIPLAVYLLNRLYSRDITMSAGAELAAYCILETASQDGKVGGPIQLATFSNAQKFKFFDDKEIKEIESTISFHRVNLKSFFFRDKEKK